MNKVSSEILPLVISHKEFLKPVYNFLLYNSCTSFGEIYEKVYRLFDRNKLSEIVDDSEKTFIKCKKYGFEILSFFDDLYPPLLKQIYLPPLILFYKGNPNILKIPYIAIVGTRKPSPISLSATVSFVEIVGMRMNTGIISGLAQGIDSEAMHSALTKNIPVIGVMGTGFDKEYPLSNRDLYKRMKLSGESLILTEMRPDDKIGKWSFPRRNRIISGIAENIVIMEAPLESGAMSTASHAISQNREILVFSDTEQNFNSGGQKLIEDGAKILTREDMNNNSKLLHITDLFPESGGNLSGSIALLTKLEMEGKVRDRGGGYFEFLFSEKR